MAHESIVHRSKGQTPHLLCAGGEKVVSFDLRTSYIGRLPQTVTENLVGFKGKLIKKQELARRNLRRSHRQQKEYDKKAHRSPLKVGDTVFLHAEAIPMGVPEKLHKQWTEPFVA
ncbi:hypothetical protein FGIG_02866 [Fasciola gigantica]|uniref:Uncharacterized protein n=1 Tax=Fasciola gigantica TaxID=46835 RepID=A0A504YHE1_FASGI|nr:hypothetical protein FGIG_02866 [Fasciola gigantica]